MPSSKSKPAASPVTEQALRDEFHRLLGRLVHAIAQFDFNIGLQLNSLGSHLSVDVSKLLKARSPLLRDRLDKLRTLVLRLHSPAGQEVLAEFKDWFKKAHAARALRNDYAHGRWGVPGKYLTDAEGRMVGATPLLAFVPIDWNLTGNEPDRSVYMTIQEFESKVVEVETLFAEYWKLLKKHRNMTVARAMQK